MAEAKFSIVPVAAARDARLTHAQFRVLSFICYYAGQKNVAWPSYKSLADDIGITKRVLIGHVNKLCLCGYLSKEGRKRHDGSASTNLFTVIWDTEIEVWGSDAEQHYPSAAGQGGGSDAEQHPLNKNTKTEHSLKKENIKKKKPQKVTLEDWERAQGSEFRFEMVASWVKENGYDAEKIKKVIPVFRDKVMAGGNLYANFPAAFKNWIREGWLGAPPESFKPSTSAPAVTKNLGARL